MHGKKNSLIDIVIVDIFAMVTISILLLLQLLIPYKWDTVQAAYTIEQPVLHVPNIVYILTHEQLSELYTCKPEQRKTNNNIVEFTYDEAQLLLKIAYSEGGEGVLGQAMCIRTIVNRIADPSFPDNIYDIVMQPGQFEVVTTGRYLLATPNANTHIALAMVEGGWDETEGATYWEASTNTNHSWHKRNLIYIKEVEGNIFYHE